MKPAYLVFLTREARAKATAPLLLQSVGLVKVDSSRILNSRLPVAVGYCGTKDAARGMVVALRAAGLDGFAITAQALRRFQLIPVHRLFRKSKAVLLTTDKPLPASYEVDDVKMIVLGKIRTRAEVVTRSSPGTLASIGISMAIVGVPMPIRSMEVNRSSVSSGEESFCCLFGRETYVIRENDFNYKASLPRVEMTRERSFLAVAALLRECFPAALFDEALYKNPDGLVADETRSTQGQGGLIDTTRSSTHSSTEQRALATARLIYLASG